MSDITKVRALCQDIPLFHVQDLYVGQPPQVADTTYKLEFQPLLDGSVVISDSDGTVLTVTTDYTVDNEAGTVNFTSAPDAETYKVKYKHTLLTDEHIQVFLDLADSDILLASALALRAIASNQALILKKIKTLDLQTDGAALAESLLKAAESMETRVSEGETDWDIAEQVYDIFGYDEKILKDYMRES